MRFPETKKGKINLRTSSSLLLKAYRSGINYFDTAYNYHHGQSQEFVANFLSRFSRDSYYLANKLALFRLTKEEDVEKYFE